MSRRTRVASEILTRGVLKVFRVSITLPVATVNSRLPALCLPDGCAHLPKFLCSKFDTTRIDVCLLHVYSASGMITSRACSPDSRSAALPGLICTKRRMFVEDQPNLDISLLSHGGRSEGVQSAHAERWLRCRGVFSRIVSPTNFLGTIASDRYP